MPASIAPPARPLPSAELHRGEPPGDWTDAELNTAILVLCDETPPARMVACWRALEHCRRHTPRGTPASLLADMREALRVALEKSRASCPGA